MKKIMIALLIGFTMSVQAQETVKLRFNYTPGDVYVMTVKTASAMLPVMSTEISVSMQMEILGKENDNFLTESRFTRIIMNTMQSGTSMNYDSSKSDDELDQNGKLVKAQMEPMMQAVINATVNPLGENLKLTVVPTDAARAGDFANQNGMTYPEKALAVGDTWSATKNSNGMTMNSTYTLKQIDDDVITVDVSGKASGMAEGKVSGYVFIDRDSGVPTESKIVVEINVMGKSVKTEAIVTMEKQ